MHLMGTEKRHTNTAPFHVWRCDKDREPGEYHAPPPTPLPSASSIPSTPLPAPSTLLRGLQTAISAIAFSALCPICSWSQCMRSPCSLDLHLYWYLKQSEPKAMKNT